MQNVHYGFINNTHACIILRVSTLRIMILCTVILEKPKPCPLKQPFDE